MLLPKLKCFFPTDSKDETENCKNLGLQNVTSLFKWKVWRTKRQLDVQLNRNREVTKETTTRMNKVTSTVAAAAGGGRGGDANAGSRFEDNPDI